MVHVENNTHDQAESSSNLSNIEFDISDLENDVDFHVAQKMNELLDVDEQEDSALVISNIDSEVDLAELSFLTQNDQWLDWDDVSTTLTQAQDKWINDILDSGTEEEKIALWAAYFQIARKLTDMYADEIIRQQPKREIKWFDIKEARKTMQELALPNSYWSSQWLSHFFSSWSTLATQILNVWVLNQAKEVKENVMVDLMKAVNDSQKKDAEEIDNATIKPEMKSKVDKAIDILFDEDATKKEKFKTGVQLWAWILWLWLLFWYWVKKLKKSVKKFKEKKWRSWVRDGIKSWLGLWWAAWLAHSFFKKYPYKPWKEDINKWWIVPESDDLISNFDNLDPVEKKLFTKTWSAINEFYQNAIWYPDDGQENAPDMQWEHQNPDGEVKSYNHKIAWWELALFVYSVSSTQELVSSSELMNEILNKKGKELIMWFVDKVWLTDSSAMVKWMNMLFSVLERTPLERNGNLETYKKSLEQLVSKDMNLERWLEQQLRRRVKFRWFMIHKEGQLSYTFAQKALETSSPWFSSLSEEDKKEQVLQSLEDKEFVKKHIATIMNKKFLKVTPTESLQFLHQEWVLQDNEHPLNVELQEKLMWIKERMAGVLWVDDDSWMDETIYDTDSPDYSDIEASFEKFFDDVESFGEDDSLIKYIPILDFFDLEDDISEQLADELWLNGYVEKIAKLLTTYSSKRPLTKEDLQVIKKEIQTFYWIRQELEMWTFFTMEKLGSWQEMTLRFNNVFSQVYASVTWDAMISWAATTIAAGYFAPKILTIPRKATKWVTIAWYRYFWWKLSASLASKAYLWVNGEAKLINHIRSWKVSLSRAAQITKKLWLTSNTSVKSMVFKLFDWAEITWDMAKVLEKNPKLLKSFITKTREGYSIKPWRNRSPWRYDFYMNEDLLKKLDSSLDALKSMKWPQKAIFTSLLKNTKNIDEAAAIINNSSTVKLYDTLFANAKKVDNLMNPQIFGKLLAKYGNGKNVDIHQMIKFLEAQKSSGGITNASRFVKNTIKHRDKWVQHRPIAEINSLRWSKIISKSVEVWAEQLAKARKVWKWLLLWLEKNKHLPNIGKTIDAIKDVMKTPVDSVLTKAWKYIKKIPWAWRLIFRTLAFAWVAVGWSNMQMTKQEKSEIERSWLNKEKVKLYEKKIEAQRGLTKAEAWIAAASFMLVKFPPWGTLAAVVLEAWMMWAWELSDAYYDTVDVFSTNYDDYIRMNKVEVTNRLVSLIGWETNTDKWWKESFGQWREEGKVSPDYDFTSLFDDSSDGAAKALVWLDEVSYDHKLAHFWLLDKDALKSVYEKNNAIQESFGSFEKFKEQVDMDKVAADENTNLRYDQLLGILPSKWGKLDLDWQEMKDAIKGNNLVDTLQWAIEKTRWSDLETYISEYENSTIGMLSARDTYESLESFDSLSEKNLEELWSLSHPMELVLFRVATEMFWYTLLPTKDAIRQVFTEEKAGEHWFYFTQSWDAEVLKINNQWGIVKNPLSVIISWFNPIHLFELDIDQWFWIDSWADVIGEMIAEITEAGIFDGDMIDTKTNSWEMILSKEYASKFLKILSETYSSIWWDTKEKAKTQQEFLLEWVLKSAVEASPELVSASVSDLVLWKHLWFSNIATALYSYEQWEFFVHTKSWGKQKLQEVLDKHFPGVVLDEKKVLV